MFSVAQKRHIAEEVQRILRDTQHPELPPGEIQFTLKVLGANPWSWADIRNNGAVAVPGVNAWNELQDPASAPPAPTVVVDALPPPAPATEVFAEQLAPSSPPVLSGKYATTDDMGEISGFGGGYELACRLMLQAGCVWFDEHPDAKPEFKGISGVYGLLLDENEDAKALTEAILDGAPGRDCTGAMMQAVTMRVLHIKTVGWDKYVEECKAYEKKHPSNEDAQTPQQQGAAEGPVG